MNIDILELLIGQIPEAIFFSLFIILGKELKEKRLLFTFLMVLQYFILKHVALLNYDIKFQILYTFMTYIILKAVYKEKSQITDIFLMITAILILGIFSVPFLLLNLIINNVYIVCFISKIFLFVFLFISKNIINKFYKILYKYWNRNDAEKRKIKSLTIRNICAVSFNLIFVLLNFVIILVKTGIL